MKEFGPLGGRAPGTPPRSTNAIAAIEAKNDTYCLEKLIEKFPLFLTGVMWLFMRDHSPKQMRCNMTLRALSTFVGTISTGVFC